MILEHSDDYINVIFSGLKILNIMALKMWIFYLVLLASYIVCLFHRPDISSCKANLILWPDYLLNSKTFKIKLCKEKH